MLDPKYASSFLLVVVLIYLLFVQLKQPPSWTDAEIETIQSLGISQLGEPPSDPTNAVANDSRAAKLGHKLFFDERMSITGTIACANCHQPENQFRDSLTRGVAIGQTDRRTPSIIGGAYSPWQYWDGRKDSQWSQALAPLEHPMEHGGNRMFYVRYVTARYKDEYEAIFGPAPDLSDRERFPEHAAPVGRTDWNSTWQAMSTEDQNLVNQLFVNIGKTIAAYERLLVPGPGRFDEYVASIRFDEQQTIFDHNEVVGLRLFIGKANCTQCHNGPLLTNNEFHNTGVANFPGEIPDKGRVQGIRDVTDDPFNCVSQYSDARYSCAELRFARTGSELIGTVRTPSLRSLHPPFMHKGQHATLREVLDHYNDAPLAMIGHNEAKPLNLTQLEITQLERFLATLNAPLRTDSNWLKAP
ncbi:MAG TPA: cytochrome-c peroxidase [Gammaproteobacteria bacterium]|nr:cytochrome-c peroxidase [Gammaproteobacteria bacterium]